MKAIYNHIKGAKIILFLTNCKYYHFLFYIERVRLANNIFIGLTMPGWKYIIREVLYDPRTLAMLSILHVRTLNSLRSRMARNPAWININSVRDEIF